MHLPVCMSLTDTLRGNRLYINMKFGAKIGGIIDGRLRNILSLNKDRVVCLVDFTRFIDLFNLSASQKFEMQLRRFSLWISINRYAFPPSMEKTIRVTAFAI